MEAEARKKKGEEMEKGKNGVNWVSWVSMFFAALAVFIAIWSGHISNRTFEFAYRPYLGIPDVSGGGNYEASLEIFNSGIVPANDVSCEIVRTFDRKGKTVHIDTTFKNMIIFPEGTGYLDISGPPDHLIRSVLRGETKWSIWVKITYQGVGSKKQYVTEYRLAFAPETHSFRAVSGRAQ